MGDSIYLYAAAVICLTTSLGWIKDLVECKGWLGKIWNAWAILGGILIAVHLYGMA